MKPALAHVSTLQSPLAKDVEDYAAGQCGAIELWWGKVDAYLGEHSSDDLRELLNAHHVATPAVAFQGGLLTSQGDARRQHWEDFSKRLAQCRMLGIGTLVLAADIAGPLTQQDLERVQVSLAQAAGQAGDANVRLALEFQAQAAFCNNLETAAALVAEVDSRNLGLCLDTFHFFTGPSKLSDLAYLNAENLFHVQLSDLAGTARELAADADRILPGDGDLDLSTIIDRLRTIDYPGYVSIELMNPHIWQVPALQFGEIAMTALRKALGQASMNGDQEGRVEEH